MTTSAATGVLVVALVTAACGSNAGAGGGFGGGFGGGSGGGGGTATANVNTTPPIPGTLPPAGVEGQACDPAVQPVGCNGEYRMICDEQTSSWVRWFDCVPGKCVSGTCHGRPMVVCERDVPEDGNLCPPTLPANYNGLPCDPALDSLGCSVLNDPSYCDPTTRTWQAYQYGCTDAERCYAVECNGQPFVECRELETYDTEPACAGTTHVAGLHDTPCDPDATPVGCSSSTSYSVCRRDTNLWDWHGGCDAEGARCEITQCGPTLVAGCTIKGDDPFDVGPAVCSSPLVAGLHDQPCNPALESVGCNSDNDFVRVCDAPTGSWQDAEDCTSDEHCVSGYCGGVASAKCVPADVDSPCG